MTKREQELAKQLVGESVTNQQLENVDCYIQDHFGLFIPSVGPCHYAEKNIVIHRIW